MRITSTQLGFYRLPKVLAILGISEQGLYAGMDTGRYPPNYILSDNTVGWKKSDIILLKKYIAKFGMPDTKFKWEKLMVDLKLIEEINEFWDSLPPHRVIIFP